MPSSNITLTHHACLLFTPKLYTKSTMPRLDCSSFEAPNCNSRHTKPCQPAASLQQCCLGTLLLWHVPVQNQAYSRVWVAVCVGCVHTVGGRPPQDKLQLRGRTPDSRPRHTTAHHCSARAHQMVIKVQHDVRSHSQVDVGLHAVLHNLPGLLQGRIHDTRRRGSDCMGGSTGGSSNCRRCTQHWWQHVLSAGVSIRSNSPRAAASPHLGAQEVLHHHLQARKSRAQAATEGLSGRRACADDDTGS